jgi:hypothetical protein
VENHSTVSPTPLSVNMWHVNKPSGLSGMSFAIEEF